MDTDGTIPTIYESKPLHTSESTNIRLVELLLDDSSHSSTTPPISCKLQVVSLDESPSYICLSYVWGTPTATKTILLDGRPFTIRMNLYDFLVQMKREGNSGLFWIDAISIDQSSIGERNHQVGMLGKIYSDATKVIAWLGAGPESLSGAIKELGILMSLELKYWAMENTGGRSLMNHLLEVCKCDYWSRIWIVQEFILSKEVELQCGDQKVEGDDFHQLMNIAGQQHDRMMGHPTQHNTDAKLQSNEPKWWRTHAYRITKQRSNHYGPKLWSTLNPRRNFQGLFEDFRTMGCADVRDRAYALLSLVEPTELSRFPIHPDYAKSASQLFLELMERRRNEFKRSKRSPNLFARLQNDAREIQSGLELRDEDPVVRDIMATIQQEWDRYYSEKDRGS